jgi:hypothetical protein
VPVSEPVKEAPPAAPPAAVAAIPQPPVEPVPQENHIATRTKKVKKGKKIKKGKRAVISSDPQPENAAPVEGSPNPVPAENVEGKQPASDVPAGNLEAAKLSTENAGEAKRAAAESERYPSLKMRQWRSTAQHQSHMLHRLQFQSFQRPNNWNRQMGSKSRQWSQLKAKFAPKQQISNKRRPNLRKN